MSTSSLRMTWVHPCWLLNKLFEASLPLWELSNWSQWFQLLQTSSFQWNKKHNWVPRMDFLLVSKPSHHHHTSQTTHGRWCGLQPNGLWQPSVSLINAYVLPLFSPAPVNSPKSSQEMGLGAKGNILSLASKASHHPPRPVMSAGVNLKWTLATQYIPGKCLTCPVVLFYSCKLPESQPRDGVGCQGWTFSLLLTKPCHHHTRPYMEADRYLLGWILGGQYCPCGCLSGFEVQSNKYKNST